MRVNAVFVLHRARYVSKFPAPRLLFPAGLQSVWQGCVHPPVTPSFGIVCSRNIHESCFESLSHPLKSAMQNIKLRADVLKADTSPAGRRHLGKTKQILRFCKGHLISMPEIDNLKRY